MQRAEMYASDVKNSYKIEEGCEEEYLCAD